MTPKFTDLGNVLHPKLVVQTTETYESGWTSPLRVMFETWKKEGAGRGGAF